jgi:hypothetical protein
MSQQRAAAPRWTPPDELDARLFGTTSTSSSSDPDVRSDTDVRAPAAAPSSSSSGASAQQAKTTPAAAAAAGSASAAPPPKGAATSASSHPPHPHPHTSSPFSVDLRYAQYSYDNIAFPDVVARSEYGLGLLESVAEAVKASAAGEEAYGRCLSDTSSSLLRVRGTGQGIGPTVDGAPQKQASFLGAGLQAMGMGGFFGGAGGAAADSNNPFGSPSPSTSQVPSSPSSSSSSFASPHSAVGNGPSSVGSALESFSQSNARAAHLHLAAAQHLRRLHATLLALRDHHGKAVAALAAKANEAVRATQGAAKELERAQARVDRSRRELLDAEDRLASARASGGAVQEQEVQRRTLRAAQAQADLDASEGAVLAASEGLVHMRRRRDDELTACARQLQRLDEERVGALARSLSDLAGTAAETAAGARALASALGEAAANAMPDADVRTFMYQRRIAHMLAEQTALQDARAGRGGGGGGGGAGGGAGAGVGGGSGLGKGDEEYAVVPQPHPVAQSLRHNRDFIQAEKALSPVVARWVRAVLDGKGYEQLNGARVEPAAGTARAGEEEAAHDGSAAAAGAKVEGEEEEEGFDVDMLDHHAARIALLRTLNLQRSKKQDIGPAFPRLARVLWWLLDACEVYQDICCARMVMVMAETFFRPAAAAAAAATSTAAAVAVAAGPDGGAGRGGDDSDDEASSHRRPSRPPKEFLQAVVKRHPIWKSEAFWSEVFYQSTYDALRAACNPYAAGGSKLSPLSGGGGAGGGGGDDDGGGQGSPPPSPSESMPSAPSFRPGTADWNYGYTQTIFSQLAAVAMNMITFGMPAPHVVRTITGLARGNGLPNEMTQALHETVKTYAAQG